MDRFVQNIEPMLQKLSEVFCVSVDTIRESGMEYILMYGRYYYITSIINKMLIMCILLSLVALLVCVGFLSTISQKDLDKITEKKLNRITVVCCIISYFLLLAILFVCFSLPYWLTPEMYSINAVIELMQPTAYGIK